MPWALMASVRSLRFQLFQLFENHVDHVGGSQIGGPLKSAIDHLESRTNYLWMTWGTPYFEKQ